MGYDICFNNDEGEVVAMDYLSYNFSAFKNIWSIHEMNNKTGDEALPRLLEAKNTLEENGHNGIFKNGEDAWSKSPNVFLYHIKRLIMVCMCHRDCRISYT